MHVRGIVGQAQEHGGEGGGIVSQHRQVEQRDRCGGRSRIDAHPAFLRRVEVIDQSALGKLRIEPNAFALDVRDGRFRYDADLQDLWPGRYFQRDAVDAVLAQEIEKREATVGPLTAAKEIFAKAPQLTRRGTTFERHRGNRRFVQSPRQLQSDLRAVSGRQVVDHELRGRHAERQLIAIQRREGTLAGLNCADAEGTRRRIRVQLLDGPSNEAEELLYRLPIRGAHLRADSCNSVG